MIHKVKGCRDCPGLEIYSSCGASDYKCGLTDRFPYIQRGVDYGNLTTPDWCPLRNESITIELEEV